MALKGVLSAIVTPFTADGEQIDEGALRRLVDQHIADGVDGFVPAGGTGEFSVLSHQERLRLVEIVVEQTAGRATVLAHTGATSTREAIALSRHAEKVGATAIMLATPYYEPIGFDEAYAYYAAIADATSLPICAYNFPPATGLHLDVDFLVKLATEIPQVKFVKDSSANISQMNTLISEHSDKIGFLNGEDVLMLPALMLKAPGMVMGIANFMTPALSRLQRPAMRVTMQRSRPSGVKSTRSSALSVPGVTTAASRRPAKSSDWTSARFARRSRTTRRNKRPPSRPFFPRWIRRW